MRDSWGSLLIKVPRSANRLYKTQLKVGKEDTNEVGRESDEEQGRMEDSSLGCENGFSNCNDRCGEHKQENMQMKILKEACMEECNPALCPMEPGLKLSNAEDEPEVEATQYRKMIDDSLTDVRILHFTTNQMLKNYLSLDMAIMRVPDIIAQIRRIFLDGYGVLVVRTTYSRSRKRSGMVVGESSQPHVKDTTLTFQCPILMSTNYTVWKMRVEVLVGIHRIWDVVDPGSDDAKKNNIVKGLGDRVKEARLQTLITEFENLKMPDNDSIDAYAAKLSGITSKSATLGEVMSKHKLVKKFLTSLPRCFVHIVAALEQVLDLKSTGFEDVVGRLKAGGRGRGSYSRGRGRGRGQGRGRDNSQNQGQRDSSKNRENNEQNGKQHEKRDLSHIQCYRCHQYIHFVSKCPERNRNHEVNLNETQEKCVYHEEGTFFMMNHIQETIFMNEEKYTPPKSESNTNDKDDVWYFDNGASNHITGNYSYFYELNENITGRVRFGDGSCVSIKGKGSILFQGKNEEQKLLKNVFYIPAPRSNVISLGQATISGYDISIRGDFLTMRDSWGCLLIKVPRCVNRLYKAQLIVGKEDTYEVGRESDEEVIPHSSLVTIHKTSPESEEDNSGSDDTPNPLV
ncbi:initiator tRNA phosphoribosyl transferase [Tanacetum coccineum]|uniref:Initiator tRNA phosphoribosyl transferase n=1 Tax=Tanacetum coccineum TaxID=301880 RepID=A0ABQ4XA65_9ASTR